MKLCAALLLPASSGAARAVESAPSSVALHTVSPQQLHEQAQSLRPLMSACAGQATRCEDATLPNNERVGEPGPASYPVHWEWLRDALRKAKLEPDAKARQTLMDDAQDRLQEIAQQTAATGAAPAAANFARARSEADTVLRTPEFDRADPPTWWDRKKAQMRGWLASLFNGVDRLGEMAPWIGKLLEWLLFLSAAVGLLIFLLRTLRRQRLRVALGAAAPIAAAWQRNATDWAERAHRHAAAAEWREAVHCLYWAAIVLLEGRSAWRHNPTRTPREYVQLLKPGSAQQTGLRRLTQIFERVWYGQQTAEREAWQSAESAFQQLERGAETPTGLGAGR